LRIWGLKIPFKNGFLLRFLAWPLSALSPTKKIKIKKKKEKEKEKEAYLLFCRSFLEAYLFLFFKKKKMF
jgi:hypothetical protein